MEKSSVAVVGAGRGLPTPEAIGEALIPHSLQGLADLPSSKIFAKRVSMSLFMRRETALAVSGPILAMSIPPQRCLVSHQTFRSLIPVNFKATLSNVSRFGVRILPNTVK